MKRITALAPIVSVVVLAAAWGRELPLPLVLLVDVVLAGAVMAAVHHAEVVAHRVGEPYGSLILAVAVTVIEVALIVTLMASGDEKTASLARDTVFAAVMITTTGIIGLCLLVGPLRHRTVVFNAEGSATTLSAVAVLTTLCLVLPSFTIGEPGPVFTTTQLVFAATASLAIYAVYVFAQTVRHRDYFLPPDEHDDPEVHADPPSDREAWTSLGLLLVSLVGVVGLAKIVSPSIEEGVRAINAPPAFVGVVIALLVLAPETVAAVRAAGQDRVQVSLNLALGSALASIGLTIPAIAVASIWLPGDLVLGLGPTQMVLFALTMLVTVLTVTAGRATLVQGSMHLAIFFGFIVTAIRP